MITATAKLKSASPFQFSKHYDAPKLDRELPHDYETRTWRERAHYDDKGNVFLPPMMFKNSIAEAAKYLSMPVKGKRMQTYTKHFEAGVLVVEPVPTGYTKDTLEPLWLFVPSDGRRGGGSRVNKCFPVMRQWAASVEFLVLDEIITEDVFRTHLETSGQLIGIGAFRPRNNGFFGRFTLESLKWTRSK